jgi:hypothetical protein
MASMFGFKSRGPARDRETDTLRHDRLAKLLDQVAAEIAAEREGLEARYNAASTNAAFLVEATENDAAPAHASARVNELTASILNCERRISVLARQLALMKQFRELLTGFLD